MVSYELYVSIYLLIVLLSICGSFFNIEIVVPGIAGKRQIILKMMFLSLALAILASLRPDDTPDTMSYYHMYSNAITFSDLDSDMIRFGNRYQNMEVLFVILMGTMRDIGFTFREVLFSFAFINSFSIQYACCQFGKEYVGREPNLNRMLAIYLSLFAYHYSCIAIRAGFSIGIGLLGILFLVRNSLGNKIKGIVMLYMACLSHSMAILLIIPLLVLAYKKMVPSRTYMFITAFICIVSLSLNLGEFAIGYIAEVLVASISVYDVKGFGGYVNYFDPNVGLKKWLIVINALGMMYLISRQSSKNKILLTIVTFGLYITSFAYPIRAINRAADYFFIFMLPMVSSMNIHEYRKWQYIYITCFSNLLFLLYQMNL